MPKRVKPETDKKQQDRYYEKYSHKDFNSQDRYTPHECMTILFHMKTDVEISIELGRTLKAIQVKRVRLLKKEKLK